MPDASPGSEPRDRSRHPASGARRPFVLAVSSNKGGVGKTTIASNLAIYLRALREELPILLVGLDDQETLDRMFSLQPSGTAPKNLKHGWAERSLSGVIQLGEYGIHFVPSPPDVGLLKGRAEDPKTLRRILDRTGWDGLVILDTKSDLEALTQNAYEAADRILIPVADWASLEEASKIFRLLQRGERGVERARVVLSLADRRTRGRDGERPLVETLAEELDRRGWPRFRTVLSRSPRVEALNSSTGTPLSILHHARGTDIHRQLRALAEEVLAEMGQGERLDLAASRERPRPPRGASRPRRRRPEPPAPSALSLAAGLLGALLGRDDDDDDDDRSGRRRR